MIWASLLVSRVWFKKAQYLALLEDVEFLIIATVHCNMNAKDAYCLLWGVAMEGMVYARPIRCGGVIQGLIWWVEQGRVSKVIIESPQEWCPATFAWV